LELAGFVPFAPFPCCDHATASVYDASDMSKAAKNKRAAPAAVKSPSSKAHGVRALVAIVVSRYNETVTDSLLAGALAVAANASNGAGAALLDVGAEVIDAPGAYEVVPIAAAAARSGRYAGVLGLGCIIKGETRHDEFLAHAVTSGLANISIATGVPTALGVLTVNTAKQARERSGGKHGNKGAEAMSALLHTIAVCRAISAGRLAPALAHASPDKLS